MSPHSSTSPSDSIRFLPTSIDMIGAYSISRSLIRLPARAMISTRSRHGTAAHLRGDDPALAPARHGGKSRLSGTGGSDGLIDVGDRPARECPEDDVAIDRRA